MLDSRILRRFGETFLGYGNLRAPIWFIGLEEGSSGKRSEIDRRLEAWQARGCRSVEDVAEFHRAIGDSKWFRDDKPPTQPTWRRLIRAVLARAGDSRTTDEIREYQRDHWGRPDSETACLEIFPFPCKNLASWPYKQWTSAPEFESRKAYKQAFAPLRLKLLRNNIRQYRPKFVVFYGRVEAERQRAISGVEEGWKSSGDIGIAERGRTTYFSIKHPANWTVKNQYFDNLGVLMAQY